jgi:hypothetical protein
MGIGLKDILKEAAGQMPKDSWVPLSGKALDKFKDEISDLLAIASKNSTSISAADIKDKPGYKYMALDLDKDTSPDAIKIYKQKGSGKVIIGVGHDDSNKAKQQLYTMKDIQKGIEDQDEGLLGTLRTIISKIF